MEKYFESDFEVQPVFQPGSEFGDLEFEAMLMRIRETAFHHWFQIRTGGSIATKPLLLDKRLYFGACDHIFYCLDAETGEEIWRFKTKGPIISSPAFFNGRLYFGSWDGNLYCLNLQRKPEWTFPAGDKIVSQPLIHFSQIYFGCKDGNLYCLDQDGTLLWRRSFNEQISYPIVPGDGCFYLAAGKTLYKLDPSGRPIWRFSSGNVFYYPFLSPDSILVGSRDCNLYCLDLQGRLIWKFRLSDPIGPVIREGERVFCGSWDGNLYCLDAKTGQKLWKFSAGGLIPCPNQGILLKNKIIYFGTWNCWLYALGTDGKLRWKFHTSLSHYSQVEIVPVGMQRVEFKISLPEAEEEKKKYQPEERDIADYGSFSGRYIDITKSDYLGKRKKGYLEKA